MPRAMPNSSVAPIEETQTYAEKKRAEQARFRLGSLASYAGQRKDLVGTVKIVGHEKAGGIVTEVDGITAVVSPFTLTPLGVAPPRPAPKPKPTARRSTRTPATPRRSSAPATIYRNGHVVEHQTPAATAPPVLPEGGDGPKGNEVPNETTMKLEALAHEASRGFLEPWLHRFRMKRSRDHRQHVIDEFDLGVWLARMTPAPQPEDYKMTVYYLCAAMLQHPARLPAPTEILDLLAARFPMVRRAALNADVAWMTAKLDTDHKKWRARIVTNGVTNGVDA